MEEIPMYAAMKSVGVTDEKAERVVQALDDKIDNKVNFGINAVRGDIAMLRGEFALLKGELVRIEAEIAKVDSKVGQVDHKVDQFNSKVDHKIDSIRWIIGILVPVCAILVTATIAFITH